jgi:ribosomal protein S18 acetylase RimI-like enzyme
MYPRDTMYPHIGNLVVDNEFRRKGIALSLMNQAIKTSIDWGSTSIFCAVETDNKPASDLYINKLGFQVFLLEKKDESDFFNPLKKDRYILLKRIGNQKAESFSDMPLRIIEDSL